SPIIVTDDVSSLKIPHNRASKAFPANGASALSLPNRELAPPASTNPAHVTALFTDHPSRISLFHSLAPRPPNPQLAQFFLQALTVQANRRSGARNIPSVGHELFGQIGDFELVLGLAKILFAQSSVRAVPRRFVAQGFATGHLQRQIGDADLLSGT